MPFDRTIFDQNLQSLADSSQTIPRDIFLTAKAIKEVELTELYTLINDKSTYLGEVASEAEMLALTGNKADWVIRTDTTETWIITGDDPSLLTSWTKLAATTPVPTDLSELNNDVGFITSAESPSNLSELNNDAGFITSITKEAYSTDTFVGDGSNSQFTVKPNHNEHSMLVFYNGICLVPGTDYNHSPDLIQLTFVPVNQSDIVIRYLPI